MKLRIKEEYLTYSIGGGRMPKTKLHDIPEELYQKYYDMGYSEFFEVVKEKVSKKNDTNSKGSNSSRLSDTNRKSDTK